MSCQTHWAKRKFQNSKKNIDLNNLLGRGSSIITNIKAANTLATEFRGKPRKTNIEV